MVTKKPTKPTTDALIGREVRIHADATYPNGNAHAWAGFPGKVLKHNGKSVYQINMAEGQAVAVFALDQFEVIPLPGEHTTEHPEVQAPAQADPASLAKPDLPLDPAAQAPTDARVTLPTGEMLVMDHALIVRSRTNPRKHFDADALAELAVSIKLHNLAQPILVRPLPKERVQDTFEYKHTLGAYPTHEIVAGERRWRACKIAGVKRIPVLVRDLSDTQVLELQLVENLARTDLHPLEEAEGFEALMQATGMTAAQVGERMGKSRTAIYNAIKLLDLSPDSRQAFYDGKLSPTTAILVARHIPQHQAEIIDDICHPDHLGDVMSSREAQSHILRNFMLRLDKAPFDRDDAGLLPKAGTCTACPKRTGANPDLFVDVDHADTCTDKACFAAKRDAHLQRQVDEAAAQGKELITGKEALAILPSQYQDPKGYMLLDKVDYGKLGGSTLRQSIAVPLLVDEVLIANPHTHELVAALPMAKAKQLLAEHAKPSKGAQESAKLKAETAYQLAWRERAAMAVFQDALAEAESRATLLPTSTVTAIRLAAKRLCPPAHQKDDMTLLCKLIGLDSKVGMHSALIEHIDKVSRATAEAVLCAILAMDDVDYSPMYKTPHPSLDALAEPLGIDLEAIREEVKDELRAEAKDSAKAKAKAAVKAAVKTVATPGKPAPAAADLAKPTLKGKGKVKTTPEEAQAAIAQAMQDAEGAAA